MSTKTLEIDKSQFKDIGKMPEGQKVVLTVIGTVASNRFDKAIVNISSILGRPATTNDAMSELVEINKEMLSELRQLPKVMPLGET